MAIWTSELPVSGPARVGIDCSSDRRAVRSASSGVGGGGGSVMVEVEEGGVCPRLTGLGGSMLSVVWRPNVSMQRRMLILVRSLLLLFIKDVMFLIAR